MREIKTVRRIERYILCFLHFSVTAHTRILSLSQDEDLLLVLLQVVLRKRGRRDGGRMHHDQPQEILKLVRDPQETLHSLARGLTVRPEFPGRLQTVIQGRMQSSQGSHGSFPCLDWTLGDSSNSRLIRWTSWTEGRRRWGANVDARTPLMPLDLVRSSGSGGGLL